jgi:hypothetical protein
MFLGFFPKYVIDNLQLLGTIDTGYRTMKNTKRQSFVQIAILIIQASMRNYI